MLLDLDEQSPGQIYHTMTQSLIPRPVAWVLSENPEGNFNLAPFSYFTAVTSDPPLILISAGKKADGSPKDTRGNILARQHFVVHIGSSHQAGVMTETARPLPLGDSELEATGLATVPFDGFPLPRLADAPVAMACELYQEQTIGPKEQSLIFGRVRRIYLNDEVASVDGDGRLRVDALKVDPLARLGADEYATLGRVLHVPRPR
ncbi:MAG: flavin reductase family protein [Oleiphilaceae bacterium]|nr:flavin reductase family protein [Oleiphilaceae bacterium]